jgi:uncharacterized protein involved in outer membrane biogenesis
MKLLRWIAGIVGIVILVPVIGIAVFMATFNAETLKKDLMAQLSQKIGRTVAINGDVGFALDDGLTISLNQVQIDNPQGFTTKEFVSIGNLQAAINWKAIVRREIDVKSVSIADANIQLITNAAGKNNWDMKLATRVPDAEPKLILAKAEISDEEVVDTARKEFGNLLEGKKPDFTIKRVALNSLELKNTLITQTDARSGKKQTVEFADGTFKMPLEGAFNADAKGKYNGATFDVDFSAEKGIQDLIAGKATPIDLKAVYMGEPYAVKAMFARSANSMELNNLEARVKEMDWTGVLHIATGGAKPAINGSLATAVLDLTKLAAKTALAKATLQPAAQIMATPRARLIVAAAPAPDLTVLKMVNAEVKLAIGQFISSPTLTLDKVVTLAKISSGRLLLEGLTFDFLGTNYKGLIEVDGNSPKAMQTHVVLNGSNVDFAAVAKAFGSDMPLDSKGNVSADLRMSGFTPEAMTRSLGGKLELVLGAGTLDMAGADQTAVSLAKFLFPKGAVQDNPRVSCAAMRFNAANGVLNTNGMVIDSNMATVGGEGSIDLGMQTVNLVLKPVPKGLQGADLLVVPVRVSGPTAKPSFMPQEGAVLNKAAAILSGNRQPINTGVPKVEASTAGNDCLIALNNPKPIMITPPTAKEAVQQVKDQAKEVINLGKDVFKDSRDATKGDATKQEQVIDKLKQLKGIFGQ